MIENKHTSNFYVSLN